MSIKKMIIIFLSIFTLVLVGCSNENNTNYSKGSDTTNKGPVAHEFELENLDGDIVKLSDFEGEKVVIRFWASWCSICLSELDNVNTMSATSEGYKVITIVTPDQNGEKSKSGFKKWFNALDYDNIEVLFDSSGDVFREYGVRGYPTTAMIGTDGVLSLVLPGPMGQSTVEENLKSIK